MEQTNPNPSSISNTEQINKFKEDIPEILDQGVTCDL